MSDTVPTATSDKLDRYGIFVLLAVTAAAYLGLVNAGFVWDDQALVVRNSLTDSLRHLPTLFSTDLWDGAPVEQGVSGYYRPLLMVSFALDRAIFGMAAAGYHLHSLAWHLLAVAMTWRLLRMLASPAPALAGAAIMALHPIQSEAVAWVAARNDPMAAALGLAALVCVFPDRAGRGRLLAGGVLTWAALLTKESVVLLPALLFVLDQGRGGSRPWRRYLPLLLGIGAGVGMRMAAGIGSAAMPTAGGWALLARRAVEVGGVYGAALAAPWPLSGTRSIEWLDREPVWRTAVGLAALCCLLITPLLVRGRRRRLALVGLAWWALAVLPTLVPVADKGVIGDRYSYLGVVGVGILLVGVAGRAAPLLVVAALPAWLWMLHARMPDWVDDVSLWTAANEDTPSPYTQAGLGHVLLIEGYPELALPLFVRSLDDDPPSDEGCVAVMAAADALDQPGRAERLGRWALRRGCPRTGEHLGYLGLLQARLGQWDRARRTLADAPWDPNERDLVPRAALAWRAGDGVAYKEIEDRWVDIFPLQDKVRALQAEAAARPRDEDGQLLRVP